MSKYQKQPMNFNFGKAKGIVIGLIVLIVIGVIAAASVAIVDAGYRGVLLHWSAVDLVAPPLDEGLHFVIPFQDSVVPIEVRTLKYTKSTTSASRDLQTVSTEITVNYHPDQSRVNYLYKEVGLDYENRIIQPTVEEVVKQVTANYNAEELITKRPLVKQDIEAEIGTRLSDFNIQTEIVSITDFQFSILFSQAVESKVEAEQRALQAENDLRRIEVEARQFEAQSVGIAQANIAEATGEAEAINIINQALANNPFYLEWLKIQKWDGILPLVTGGDGATPFIEIPTKKP
ncbi:MAG: prohibitin family protein [Crenarchaeota archaeon]|nr:prohibitin family protein [Thermoproteota archaeon]